MKLTLANIKEIKRKSESPLKRRVCNYVIECWSEYSDKSGIFTDVLYHGCQSGIVGELIYYTDTVRFYKQYRSEINELLYDTMNGTGLYAPTSSAKSGTKRIRSRRSATTRTYSHGSASKKR